jgi:hypothetical protein
MTNPVDLAEANRRLRHAVLLCVAFVVLGALLAVLLRNLDPPPMEKRYSGEGEEEDPDDENWQGS